VELQRFHADDFLRLAQQLIWIEANLTGDEYTADAADTPANPRFSEERVLLVRRGLFECKFLCEEVALQVAMRHVDELLAQLDKYQTLDASDICALRDNVVRELSCHVFVALPPERIELFTAARKGWEFVVERFPEATDDVEEMNKCYALCRYSAAVFHSLLVVEHGLVALGKMLGVSDRKEGWDATCRRLEAVLKAGRSANETGLPFDWLDQLNACVQSMKLAWRNKVNHATGKPVVMSGGVQPYVAEEILSANRSFLRRLSEQIHQS